MGAGEARQSVERENSFGMIPRHPVADWVAFSVSSHASVRCLVDAPSVVYTTSGRAAIAGALRLAPVLPGDHVLVPTYHCPSMVAPIGALEARPLFYPISSTGAPIRSVLDDLAREFQPRAMIAAHFFGLPQPMAELRAWCDAHRIVLIEDCAHALFGTVDGRPVGGWGDFAIASLTKFFPVPEGGLLVSNREERMSLALHSRPWSDHVKAGLDIVELAARHGRFAGLNTLLNAAYRIKNKLLAARRGVGGGAAPVRDPSDGPPEEYLAFDARRAGLAIATPCRWVARHAQRERIVRNRRDAYQRLARELGGREGIRPLVPALAMDAVPYVFPLWVERPASAYRLLRSRNFPLFRWDWTWPGTPSVEGDWGGRWASHVFQIACHQDLRDADIAAIVDDLLRACD